MRAIDADKLGEVKFHSLPYTHITPSDVEAESYKRGWNDAIDSIIENAPTIESEIIRCKACKYRNKDRECTQYDDGTVAVACIVPDDHYCGYAERRTDDQSK